MAYVWHTAEMMAASKSMIPCPFCGGEGRIGYPYNHSREKVDESLFEPECEDCGCRLNPESTVAAALQAWNARVAHAQAK